MSVKGVSKPVNVNENFVELCLLQKKMLMEKNIYIHVFLEISKTNVIEK